MSAEKSEEDVDLVFVGAGVMSATLAVLLKEFQPSLKMEILESLDAVAGESSNAWNNAGTGHAALCELNYTPQRPDGSVNLAKALEINESFEMSKQFWAHLVTKGAVRSSFIQTIPHISFVHGEKNVGYLKKRYDAMHSHHCFDGMQFSSDRKELMEWMPVIMDGRDPKDKVAATRMVNGADVDFGALTKSLIAYAAKQKGVSLHMRQKVVDLKREADGAWKLKVQDKAGGGKRTVRARFVFLGAGGGALTLLQKSGIPESKGFGGFPVSGQWLRCDNQDVVRHHHAKVYGKAAVGSPPMSVPHLDTRVVDGKQSLLFGPYAGFSTRFLKSGSLLDLPLSIKPDNLVAMLAVGRDNMDLTKYLIGQVLQSPKDRFAALQEFVPKAKFEDWRLEVAGQRVQIIKKDRTRGGILQFGTEVVSSSDGSLAALLGASPGASTAVAIMLHVIKKCFKQEFASPAWQQKLHDMVPSYGEFIAYEAANYDRIRARTDEILGLDAEHEMAL